MKNIRLVALGDLKGMSQEDIKDHINRDYEAARKKIDNYTFLIAYESVGDWGCDSSSWFLMRDKRDGKLYENHGSHCSCHGFEGQWFPEETTVEYLSSEKFYLPTGGYDTTSDENKKAVKAAIKRLAKGGE
jgi:hypothetical protein